MVKFHDFLNALASAKNSKQPGSDGVVAKMVRALSWATLLWLYLLFLIRLAGWETEKPETWNEVILTAIPKKTDKVGLQSMRYISLLPVLQKLDHSCFADCCKNVKEDQMKHIFWDMNLRDLLLVSLLL